MILMGLPPAAFALWNWHVADRIQAAHVRGALAAVSGRPVLSLGGPSPGPVAALRCDVWHGAGDFPTGVDCYLAPTALVEVAVAAGLATRLGAACLLPDDTLNPSRYLLVGTDRTVRPVHVDVGEDDAGPVLTRPRPCTSADPWCRRWPDCERSRWAPDSVAPAAA